MHEARPAGVSPYAARARTSVLIFTFQPENIGPAPVINPAIGIYANKNQPLRFVSRRRRRGPHELADHPPIPYRCSDIKFAKVYASIS
ncbi:hypothetical protein EVAR_14294_1 [Eumeta japonica]|uniref:Uncharacterized protein n=1 Tax=Eumeta variegata TaxID=151549 RepID=A0A4C1ULX7_EUMVA|nr:hypothetical protein EVAR_14294_1 [Eumeta japonica]